MIWRLLRRKSFMIAAAVLIVIGGALVFVLLSSGNDVSIESVEESQQSPDIVDVDYGTYPAVFTNDTKELIDSSLSSLLKKDNVKDIKVVAREGSYQESLVENTPVKQLLLDISSLKRTYLVYKSEGGVGNENILYVRCADKQVQLSPDWECIDETE
jgi:hypothetical protein